MKTTVKNTIIALGVLAIAGLSYPSMAAPGTKDPVIVLKAAGLEANQPVFVLEIANSLKELYFITITDQDKVVLYDEGTKDELINRRFRLNTEELNDAVLRVTVTARKNGKPSVFEIRLNTKTVREALVTPVAAGS